MVFCYVQLENSGNFTELDSSIALLRGALSELGRFKVVGLISKVLLVVDTGTDGSFVIKVLVERSDNYCQRMN